ncbi:MAG: extracellular solute-binding protein [Paracoccaceae bacterium]
MATAICASLAGAAAAEDKQLNILTWAGLFSDKVLADYTALTGNATRYDASDSDDMVETRLLAGGSGYDVTTSPAVPNLARLIKAGALLPLDPAKVPNMTKQDPVLLEMLKNSDPDASHSVVVAWGTTGLSVNMTKLEERLPGIAADSYDLLFKPENAAKLADCGIAIIDSPTDVVPIVLNYLGFDPNSEDQGELDQAMAVLAALKPHLRYVDNVKYVNDLANGDTCMALGWSGDVFLASNRAVEAGNGQDIRYILPKEGTLLWITGLAIPADAPNPDAAMAFLNHMLTPDVAAEMAMTTGFPQAVPESRALLPKEIAEHPAIYPSDDQMATLFSGKVSSDKYIRLRNRAWVGFKTGN